MEILFNIGAAKLIKQESDSFNPYFKWKYFSTLTKSKCRVNLISVVLILILNGNTFQPLIILIFKFLLKL